jgi:putative flippase GtrA
MQSSDTRRVIEPRLLPALLFARSAPRDRCRWFKGIWVKQIAIYATVGLATLATYSLVVFSLSAATGLIPGVVSMIGYTVAAAVNFLGHALFTFQTTRTLRSTFPRYGLLLAFNALIGGVVVQIGVSYLGLTVPIANAIMLGGVTISTFFLMKWWVMAGARPS